MWSLGVMYGVMRAGLVPDAGSAQHNPKPKYAGNEAMDTNLPLPDPKPLPGDTQRSPVPLTPAIDVTARREWCQRILYYIAAHLGIKKAYAILSIDEGVLEKSKIAVEAMVGKPVTRWTKEIVPPRKAASEPSKGPTYLW